MEVATAPASEGRLYIGNLGSKTSSEALSSLLSRFGVVQEFQRSACGSFAHATLRARDGTDDDQATLRCISSLNHATWRGVKIRVERAREHYMRRLTREWAEEKAPVQKIQEKGDRENLEKTESEQTCFVKNENAKHEHFNFPDLPESELMDVADAFESEMPTNDFGSSGQDKVRAAREPAIESARIEPSVSMDPVSTKNDGRKPQRGIIDSTMQLFGISVGQKRTVNNDDSTSAKRKRQSSEEFITMEDAKRMEEDPSLVNMEKEKRSEMAILQRLLSDQTAEDQDTGVARGIVHEERREGLFRKLVNFNGQASGPTRRDPSPTLSLVQPTSSLGAQSTTGSSRASFRRAGLYKQLFK